MSSPAPRPAALSLLLLALCACGKPTPPPRPNLILITIDTLRQDHLSSYGYARDTSPFLDSLAANGARFTRAYSTSSWTVPAVASLMTSLHPESHGVVSGAVSAGEVRGQQILSGGITRLPELLQQAGYKTFGITANGHLTAELGYAQGFDRYENFGFGVKADELNGTLARWKDEIVASAPYFLWLHYFDPHAPYVPRAPWLAEYAPKGIKKPRRLIVNHAASYLQMAVGRNPLELEYVVALYDSEIAFTDRAIEQAVTMLDPGSESLILVTSDHGEEFRDHGGFGHSSNLFEESVKIPLIVRLPRAAHAGRVVDEPTSLVDVGPGLLDYLGVEVPQRFQGSSFMPLVEGRRPDSPRAVLSSLSRDGWPETRAIVQDGWKYIRASFGSRHSRELLFHLDSDPAERENLAADSRLERTELSGLLDERLARYASDLEPEIHVATDETLDELRSLGYLK